MSGTIEGRYEYRPNAHLQNKLKRNLSAKADCVLPAPESAVRVSRYVGSAHLFQPSPASVIFAIFTDNLSLTRHWEVDMLTVYFILRGLTFLCSGTDCQYICEPDFKCYQVFISEDLGEHSEEIEFRRTQKLSFTVWKFSFAECFQFLCDYRNNPENNNQGTSKNWHMARDRRLWRA
ncbi:MAG: hypothetical protein WC637_19420, partial [Victivallales bacterium]